MKPDSVVCNSVRSDMGCVTKQASKYTRGEKIKKGGPNRTDKAEETRAQFRALLDKTNKEHPHPKDVRHWLIF